MTFSRLCCLGALALVACDDAPPERLQSTVTHTRPSVTAAADGAAPVDTWSPDVEIVDDTFVSSDVTDADVTPDTPSDTTPVEVDTDEDTTPADTIGPVDPWVTPPAPLTLSASTLARIDVAMRDALDEPGLAGRSFGGLVVDLETDQIVWALDADRLLIPASNTKVFTTAAAIDLLGEDHRALSRVFSADPIGPSGALTSELALHSEHDFTWSRWFYADPRHVLDRLADRLHRAGLRSVRDVGVWGAYCYEGNHYATYDPATHRRRVGDAFIAALRARGITVSGAFVDHATMEVPPGVELARWESIPLQVGAWAINRRSHNEMADILARHLGFLEGGASDYVTGGQVIADWLAGTGADATGFRVDDGSGLALGNRVTARHLVAVYRYMSRTPSWSAWLSSLSVAGVGGPASVDANDSAIVTENTAPYNGTLSGRMSGADTAGRVLGKSGTNAGITTSGVLFNRHDGHRYAFAFLMNDISSGAYNLARATQDALVAVIARDHEARGARPPPPTLGCVRALADGRVELSVNAPTTLDTSDPRSGYRVETSLDGRTFSDDATHFSTTPTVVLAPSPYTRYVRVIVESRAGPSDPSDVYAVRAAGGARVLLVDADDRWQRQPTNENSRAAAHEFMVDHAAAIPEGFAFDTCPNEATTDGTLALAAYDIVVWSTGEEAATDESFSSAEQATLADYLTLGGALFASGAEIGWDLDPTGNNLATTADRDFYQRALSSAYAGDDAGVFVAEGSPGGLFSDLVDHRRLGFFTPGRIFVAYPDELTPLGDARPCLTYLGPDTTACVQSDEPRVVTLGFPFESIDGAAERALVMQRVLDHLRPR